ncbi:MAG: FAD-binding oxidoreductase [Acidimicrobiia bacterium]|nr:FAD-binding oxidoreductase [Acidimicrobiia bacterium]
MVPASLSDRLSTEAPSPTIAPSSVEELAEVLAACAAERCPVTPLGGGTDMGIGWAPVDGLTVSMARLDTVVDHQPDDLTVVVEGGVTLAALEAVLSPRRQMAVLPNGPGRATVGGSLAAGRSGYARGRFGPSRDHVLEVTLVTGDGRIVTAGGRVVKNVQGFDLMRLAVGSLGAVGVIARVCLKLWPIPLVLATVRVEDPTIARAAFRPWAVLETESATTVHLAGMPEDVAAQADALGGRVEDGLGWPDLADAPELHEVRIPPALVAEVVTRLPEGVRFIAQHGVGVVEVATDQPLLREWAEAHGGFVVRTRGADDGDPWGRAPASLPLQRRVVARFDPDRIINRGRLPGRL